MIPIRRLSELDPLARRQLLTRPGGLSPEVLQAVQTIVSDVRSHGEEAVRAYVRKFDKVDLPSLEVPREDWDAAEKRITEQEKVALRSAFENLTRFHRQGMLKSFEYSPVRGVLLGVRVVPYARAGLYVPGGADAYPSGVLMGAVPASVAGVREIVVCTPPAPDGSVGPTVLFAAKLSGVHRVFRIGGAQAIAAMAYGTASVPRVEIIAGPGNRFVTAAKKLVAEDVAIDFPAGPPEVLVLSDGTGNPKFLAAEMAAQAEHDAGATGILVTTDSAQAEAVARELVEVSRLLPRSEVVQRALSKNGAILIADDLPSAIAFVNEYGPQNLVIACDHPRDVMDQIRHAGAVYLGDMSPVAVGDAGVGPNATLPALGAARRVSATSANTFLKALPFHFLTREGLDHAAPLAAAMAKMEALEGHRASVDLRQARSRGVPDARSGATY